MCLYTDTLLRSNDPSIFQNVILGDEADKNDVLRHKRGTDRQYSFDVVFSEDSTQEEVYEVTTSGLVKDVLNGCVLAVIYFVKFFLQEKCIVDTMQLCLRMVQLVQEKRIQWWAMLPNQG